MFPAASSPPRVCSAVPRSAPHDDWDDDLDEGPSEADLERFGDETIRCPSCGHRYWDQLDDCPRCGASALGGRRRWPMLVLGIVGAAVVAGLLWGIL